MSRSRFLLLSAVFLIVCFSAKEGCAIMRPETSNPPAPPALTFPKSLQGAGTGMKQLNHHKLSPQLNQVNQQLTINGAVATTLGGFVTGNNVKVAMECKSGKAGDVMTLAEALGASSVNVYGDIVFADLPIAQLEAVASIAEVIRVRTPYRSYPAAMSQGVSIHNATAAHAAGYTGVGTKVGILDCGGFNGYTTLLGTDLPPAVNVWPTSGEGPGVHGLACAEIVYDMAPGAELNFAHDHTEEDFYNAVDWLAYTQEVDVISYSCTWFGPFPNDGLGLPYNTVNEKANEAVVEGQLVWVNSSGNYAEDNNYQSFYVDDGYGSHYFGVDFGHYQPWYIPAGGAYTTLTWNDWPADPLTQGSDQDYELYLWDYNANLIAWSENWQTGEPGEIPFEEIWYEPNVGEEGWYLLEIVNSSATGDHFLNLRGYAGGYLYSNPDMSVCPPAEAQEVVAVGAVEWVTPDIIEPYSSQGPTLAPGGNHPNGTPGIGKPDLVAVDGVDTETYGDPFWGTSASAPHVAGAAALYIQRYPGATPDQIKEAIYDSALDLGEPGFDNIYGHGRLYVDFSTGCDLVPTMTGLIAYNGPLHGWWDFHPLPNLHLYYNFTVTNEGLVACDESEYVLGLTQEPPSPNPHDACGGDLCKYHGYLPALAPGETVSHTIHVNDYVDYLFVPERNYLGIMVNSGYPNPVPESNMDNNILIIDPDRYDGRRKSGPK